MKLTSCLLTSLVVAGTLFAGILSVAPTSSLAQGKPGKDQSGTINEPTKIWSIGRGGQLYDNWWAVLDADEPKATHPAYPATAKRNGPTTWRCKECHGWDYKGVKGAYAKGSHRTGIKGLRNMVGADKAGIVATLRNKTHGYTEKMITPSAMNKLALFLASGQIDMDKYIDRATKKARGNQRRGAQLYQSICANCHGLDGKMLNFGSEKKPEYVGTVGKGNPWEALHKIRFGQPAANMAALSVLPIQEQVDLLAYIQGLPTK